MMGKRLWFKDSGVILCLCSDSMVSWIVDFSRSSHDSIYNIKYGMTQYIILKYLI